MCLWRGEGFVIKEDFTRPQGLMRSIVRLPCSGDEAMAQSSGKRDIAPNQGPQEKAAICLKRISLIA